MIDDMTFKLLSLCHRTRATAFALLFTPPSAELAHSIFLHDPPRQVFS